jgi:probable HAF family extracellular repeat protein
MSRSIGLTVAGVVALAGAARGQTYQATPLGSLGGSFGASVACVNNNGEAVGVSDTNAGVNHAFYWQNGVMIDLGTLTGGDTSRALWINNNGQTVGSSHDAAGHDRAVRWQRDGLGVWQISDLGTLGGATAFANKISDNGLVVGYAARSAGAAHAFLYSAGSMADLGALTYPATLGYSEAVGVNNDGHVVGYAYAPLWGPDHAWYYDGRQTDITPPGQFSFARGEAINASGMAAGITILPGGQSTGFEAATWTQAGGWVEIGVVQGLSESEAYGINDGGDVVGRSFDLPTNVYKGFVYRSGQMIDLGAQAPSGTPIVEALTINNSGWIAANATNDFQTIEAYILRPAASCYANCDGSTSTPVLNVNDFVCFQTQFAAGDPTANCDGSTAAPVLNVSDFVCFQARFAAGCP